LPKIRLLVYAQDQGGGKYIGPVVDALSKTMRTKELIVIVHSLSGAVFHKLGISHLALADAIEQPPLSVTIWVKYLKQQNISHIFCTTSSPYLDLTNCHLVFAAKKLGIPVMGILDHWKGFDRFFSIDKPVFFPDHICCIDKFCRQKIEDIGVPKDRIHITGHPHLEKVCRENWEGYMPGGEIHILLISQPNTAERSYKGIFFQQRGEYRLIDEIARSAGQVFSGQLVGIKIRLRLHPKERYVEDLPPDITMDENQDWEESLRANEIFFGLDSMALVEANLAGKYCISLELPELKELSYNSIPLSFSKKIKELSELTTAFEEAIEKLGKSKDYENKCPEIFIDSTERSLVLLEQFIRGAIR